VVLEGAQGLTSSSQPATARGPDIVISSAFGGDTAIEAVDAWRWSVIVTQALASVPS
jgi:hypothetical protein